MMQLDTATQILGDGSTVRALEDYRTFFRNHLRAMKRARQPQSTPLRAGLDCGRWVVNCECGGAIALHPEWQYAACLTCGREWTEIIFPTEEFMLQLEKILTMRPPGRIRKDPRRFWSWWPEETLRDLIVENVTRGWPVPEGVF